MESGANKSLYTLLAVIIFGIFLALSYGLFKDQLRGVLGTTVSGNSTHVNKKLSIELGNTVGDLNSWRANSLLSFNVTSKDITFSSSGGTFSGIYLDKTKVKANTDYYVTFDITKISGTVTSIGGHDMYAVGDVVYLDGVKKSTGMFEGVPYPNDTLKHTVEFWFNSDNIGTDIYDKTFYIQPNRSAYGATYTVKVENVRVVELNN